MAACKKIKLTTNEHELTLIKLLLVCAIFLLLGDKVYAEKSISTLIEEATYQEETVGDVNAAITIYEKVIADDQARRPQVARATYGAGMCYLKKGDKDKAAKLFNDVVAKFADQKVFAAKAQKELEKLQPTGTASQYTERLKNKITVSTAKSSDGDRLTIQYAVIEVCKAANVPYQWDKSQQSGGEKVRQYIEPIHFENASASEALDSVLKPVGLTYEIDNSGLYLTTPEKAIKTNKLEVENLTMQGWQLWKERKLAEAEATFKKAVEKDPQAEGAYQGLGWAQLNQGKKLNAEDSFKKCVELNPKNAAALNSLGWIAKGQGKTDEAIGWWKKAVEAAPTATAALKGLADTYLEKKQYERAVEYYKQILQYEPQDRQAQIGLDKAKNKGKLTVDNAKIQSLIKEMDDPTAKKFEALNLLVDIGEPSVDPLIKALKDSNNWQIAKALGAIKDKQAVKPLIEKWQTANFSPMKEVIAEALESITGQKFGNDLAKWQEWDKANK